jgi:hypothetical protein
MDEQGKISVTWVEQPGNGLLELMPVGEQKKHYLGDECWCGVRTVFSTCGACHSHVPIFVHVPEGKIVPENVYEFLIKQATTAIAGGHRNGQAR